MAEAKVKLVIKGKDESSKAFKSASSSFGKMKKAAGLATVAVGSLTAGLAAAVKASASFESQLSDVSTLISGDSTQAIGELRTGIQELLKTTPKSPDELGAAAYAIVSAGISDTSQALSVLESSTRLAVAGLGTTQESTDLLTSAINAFQFNAEDAESVANTLFQTVKAGKTDVSQLAQSFGQVAPIAKSTGVTFKELQAATAALTTSGVQTSVAQNNLKALFTELTREGNKVDKAFKKIGITNSKVAIESDGFVSVLNQLKTELGLTDVEFKNLFGSTEAQAAAISLTGAQSQAYLNTINSMTSGVDNLSEAYDKQNEQFTKQWQILKNNLTVALQQVGIKILPLLSEAFASLSEIIKNLPETFANISAKVKNFFTVLEEKTSLLTFFKVIWENLKELFMTAVVPAFKELMAAMQPLMPFFKALGTVIGGMFVGALFALGAVIEIVASAFIFLLSGATNVATFFTEELSKAFEFVSGWIQKLISWVQKLIDKFNKLKEAGGKIGGVFGAIGGKVKDTAGSIGGKIKDIAGFSEGGVVPGPKGQARLAMVHSGETIVPPEKSGLIAGGNMTFIVQGGTFLDEMNAEEMGNKMVEKLRTNIRF